jgi:uncharacterized SAM-binding protein YcdF (DUF218 family)
MTVSFSSPARDRNPERGGIFSKLIFLLFLIGLFSILYLFRDPLLRAAGSFWVVDERPQASDAIVILGDDDYNADRAARAAELFKAGMAPEVVASGRFLRPYASVAELERHDLADRGVSAGSIILLAHHAQNTREEALAIGQFLFSHGWKRIILVTSNYHTRRARYICERAFPAGTSLRVVAAHDPAYDPDHWWESRQGVKIFFNELGGMIVAFWEMNRYSVQTSDSALAVLGLPSQSSFALHFHPRN